MRTRRRKRGNIAPSSQAALDRNNASVRAVEALLRYVIGAPDRVEAEVMAILLRALPSQGGLAGLELPAPYNISPMSLNTQKHRSEAVVEGGFRALEDLRKRALETLRERQERQQRPSRGTNADKDERIAHLNGLVELYVNELAKERARTFEILKLLRHYAERAGELQILGKSLRELEDKYSHIWVRPEGGSQ